MQFSILYPCYRNLGYIFLIDQKSKIFFSAYKKFYHLALGAIKEHSMLVVIAKPFF